MEAKIVFENPNSCRWPNTYKATQLWKGVREALNSPGNPASLSNYDLVKPK